MSKPSDKRLLSPRAGLVPGVGVAAQDALNNVQPSLLIDGSQCFVLDQRALYEFRAGDTTAESLPSIVAPAGGQPGRWRFLTSGTASTSTDVAVSADDTTPGPLENKVAAGDGIAVETLNPGGNEQLEVRGTSEMPRVLWVDLNSTATGTPEDGSPARPFTDIQSAIDATDGTGNWQIFIAPARYQPSGLTIPANRRIRFSGLGASLNARNEANDNATRIALLAPCVIAFAATGNSDNSDIIFEDLAFQFAPFQADDSGNLANSRHRVTWRRCQVESTVDFGSLGAGTATVVDLFFVGEGSGLLPLFASAADAASYATTVVGAGANAEVVVHGDNAFFTSITNPSRFDLRDCVCASGANIAGPALATEPSCRAYNTRFGSLSSQSTDMVVEVDSATMYWLELLGQQTTGGTFKLIDEGGKWSGQFTWYVDAVNGSDNNSGLTSGTALATFAELQRRWGNRPTFTQAVTINVLSDIDEDVVLRADVAGEGRIDVIGSTTVLVAAATIATAQPWSYATGANGQAANATSAAVPDWSPYEARDGVRLFRPADNSFGFVMETAATVADARPTRMGVYQEFGSPGLSLSDLAAADVVNVEQLVQVKTFTWDVNRLDSRPGPGTPTGTVRNLYFFDSTQSTTFISVRNAEGIGNSLSVFFVGCIFQNAPVSDGGRATFLNCALLNGIQGFGLATILAGGGYLFMQAGNYSLSDIWAASAAVILTRGAQLEARAAQLGIFDVSGSGLRVQLGTTFIGDEVFGSGNSQRGADINGEAYYQSGRLPKITGALGDGIIGGNAVTWGIDLPYLASISGAPGLQNNALYVVDPT